MGHKVDDAGAKWEPEIKASPQAAAKLQQAKGPMEHLNIEDMTDAQDPQQLIERLAHASLTLDPEIRRMTNANMNQNMQKQYANFIKKVDCKLHQIDNQNHQSIK